MLFTDDTEASLRAAVALVNSAQPPVSFECVEDVDSWFAEHGYTGRHDRDDAELAALRALRDPLRALLLADPEEAAARVNALLAPIRTSPRLVRHGDSGWHVHAVPDDAPLAERVVVETAVAMIDVVRADETSRFSRCADEDCGGLVLDLSRNRSRRFCSTTCTNRNAVAAYRARRATR